MDAARLRAALSGPSRGNPWGMCGEMTGDRRSPPLGQRKSDWTAAVLPLCRFRADREKAAIRFQGAALWPRRLCSDREKTIRTALIRLLSVVSVPEEKPPTRRRHAAFFVGGLRVVLKRAPVRFPEILLRMFPPRRQRRAPCPVPCVCVSLSSLSSIAGRNLCDAPRASWSSFAGACRSSGVFARRPITSTQAGRAQSRTPSRQRIALARAGRASEQDAGPFMVRGPATGRNAFSGTA